MVLEKGNLLEEEVNIGLLIYIIVTQHHFTSLAQITRVIPLTVFWYQSWQVYLKVNFYPVATPTWQ